MPSPSEANLIHLEANDDALYITAAELLVGMAEADDDTAVIAAGDTEGNYYMPITRVYQGLYLPEQTWFGYFWKHPDDQTTMDARMLYERTVAGNALSVEATLIDSVEPGSNVEDPMCWSDLKEQLLSVDPKSTLVLGHHKSAELHDHLPTYSPLSLVDTAHYLAGLMWKFEYEERTVGLPAERIEVEDHYDDEETRIFVESALDNPDTRPAYFFWPIN